MKDIARDLGVSVVTVSKLLRNIPEIGEETRRRVLKRIKELDYRPDHAAQSLATGRSTMMGLIVPDLVNPFFAQIVKGASHIFRKQGYGLVISSSEQDARLENEEIGHMLSRRLDGILIASAQWRVESFRGIEVHKRNYVLIDRRFEGLSAHFVGTNDFEVGSMATEHLIRTGRRRIAHIGGTGISTAFDRLRGYRNALIKGGLPETPGYAISHSHAVDADDKAGYDAMNVLLSAKAQPDAVFCFNDPMAVGAMEAILDAGLRIPQDIAIIGCGNIKYSRMLRVPLSSIDQNAEGLGEQAATLSIQIAGSRTPVRPKAIMQSPSLVARDSTAVQP
jgi:LacI family transcriptional regulator